MWGRRRIEAEAAQRDAERACVAKGQKIFEALRSDQQEITEYAVLTPEEFLCLRLYMQQMPVARLDVVWDWDAEQGARYLVRLDWDISEITG